MGISFGGSSALTTPRDDLGLGFDAIDVDAMQQGYVGFAIAPIIEASLAFGQYRKMDLGQQLQPRKTDRSSDGGFNRIGAEFGKDTYETKDHGLESPVDYRDKAIFAAMIDSELVAAGLARNGVIEDHENKVIAVINAISATAATNEFDDDAANITKDFAAYKQAFRLQCGAKPTSVVIDTSVVDALMENGSVLDKFVGSPQRTARAITLIGLAAALGIDEVIEANAVKNTVSAPKAETIATSWPVDKALLFRRSTSPSMLTQQFLRTIHWAGNGSRPGCSLEEYEEPQRDAKIIRARMEYQIKTINSECALVLDGITTD